MNEHKKILSIITIVAFILVLLITMVLTINFRDFSQSREIEKAHTIASLIENGLTAHMVSGTMNQRKFFIEEAKESSGASKIWLFRTKEVIDLFGNGFQNESVRDNIDRKVIKTGRQQLKIDDTLVKSTLRITIPYIASSNQNPNCLKCHTNAKEGDVLGGVSMIFDLSYARERSIFTILKIIGAIIIFMLIFLYIVNRFLAPYTSILLSLKNSLEKASRGDYSPRIDIKNDNEIFKVAKWLNTLLETLQNTIGAIEKDISLFVADRKMKFDNPLEKSQLIVKDIANIYKFKRTIEHDATKNVIYERLIRVFKEQLHVSDLSLYEVDVKNDKRVLIYDDTPDKFCDIADINTSERCRAYRTNSVVLSDEFPNICLSCKTTKEYLCMSYPIDENISLVLNIKPDNKEDLLENKKAIGYIRNYLESARPVLQSKILTEILQRSNMIDGLTQIYNRKYLDIFMETKIKNYKEYAVAMIDIDFFKKVNDTFGHDAGDVVLKGLSEIFKKGISREDIVFRFGGEEFLIFFANPKNALRTIQIIKNNFENKAFNLNGETLHKTLSAGIACYSNDGQSPWQVIKFSDVAMYEAKNSGRNKIVLYADIEKDKTNLKNNDEY